MATPLNGLRATSVCSPCPSTSLALPPGNSRVMALSSQRLYAHTGVQLPNCWHGQAGLCIVRTPSCSRPLRGFVVDARHLRWSFLCGADTWAGTGGRNGLRARTLHLTAGRALTDQLLFSQNGVFSGDWHRLQSEGFRRVPRGGKRVSRVVAAVSGTGGQSRAGGSAATTGGKAVGRGSRSSSEAGGRVRKTKQASETRGDSLEEDFVSRILSKSPNRVEPKFLIDGKIYTMREAQEKYAPLLQKMTNAGKGIDSSIRRIRAQVSQLAGKSEEERFRVQDTQGGAAGVEAEARAGVETARNASTGRGATESAKATVEAVGQGSEKSGLEAVFLKDLLREYRGNLYVPEEAFAKSVSDMADFERTLVEAPRMSLADFKRFAAADQVEALLSRGQASFYGPYKYFDFLVNLKAAPGEPALQRTTWAMQLDEETAKGLLKSYTGPQQEVEMGTTAYVEVPPAAPHPVAATISGRVYLEAAAFASLVATAVKLAWGAGAAVFGATGVVFTFVALYLVVPVVKPLVLPLYWLGLGTARGLWALVLGLIFGIGRLAQLAALDVASTVTAVWETASRDVSLLFTDAGRLVASRAINSGMKTLGTIVFVAVVMVVLAKYTLTRRSRDYNKWDIWQAIEFGQSKPQARVEGSTGVRFEDVAGINEVVRELQELVAYLKDPQSFNTMDTKPPHGVLLEGPPGCGKTLLAKAIAGEAGVPFYQMAGSEFVEILVGVGAARIRDLFKRAKVNRPSVVFIDEIDALGAARSQGGGGLGAGGYDDGTQERETTLNQLLIELDGFDAGQGVIFMGATNRMDMLDPALMRPGRFDRKIAIRPPNAQGRLEVLKVHARTVKLAPSVDLWTLSKNLPGYTGAELAQLLQEGAVMAAQRGGAAVERRDLDKALDRVTLGVAKSFQKGGARQKPTLLRRIATHDLGLAMTSLLLSKLEDAVIEPPQRLSVVPRGETLSRVLFHRVDEESYMFERRSTLIQRLKVFLGGRAAEEVFYGRDTSTFSVQHLPDASWMAYKLVSIWNMGDKVALRGVTSPWRRNSGFSGPSVAFEGTLYDDYELTDIRLGGQADDEIAQMAKDLLDDTFADTFALLQEYKTAMAKAVYVLLEAGELYAEDLEIIVEAYPPGTPLEEVENEEEPGIIPEWARAMALEDEIVEGGVVEGIREAEEEAVLLLPAPEALLEEGEQAEEGGGGNEQHVDRREAREANEEGEEGNGTVVAEMEIAIEEREEGEEGNGRLGGQVELEGEEWVEGEEVQEGKEGNEMVVAEMQVAIEEREEYKEGNGRVGAQVESEGEERVDGGEVQEGREGHEMVVAEVDLEGEERLEGEGGTEGVVAEVELEGEERGEGERGNGRVGAQVELEGVDGGEREGVLEKPKQVDGDGASEGADDEERAAGATGGEASLGEVGLSSDSVEVGDKEDASFASGDVTNIPDGTEGKEKVQETASDEAENATTAELDEHNRRLEPRGTDAPTLNGNGAREGLQVNGREAVIGEEMTEEKKDEGFTQGLHSQGDSDTKQSNGAGSLAADDPSSRQPEPVTSTQGSADTRTD